MPTIGTRHGSWSGLLRELGDLDGAIAVLRRQADAGESRATAELAGLLREQDNIG
jgi:hypothetical protein